MKNKIILNSQNLLQFILGVFNCLKCKKLFILLFLIFSLNLLICTFKTFSQSVGIGESTFTPDASAMLEVSGTNKGVLINRMNIAQRNSITSPATGLIIYNTDCNNFNYYNGSSWVDMIGNAVTANSPVAPVAGTHTPSPTQIVWNWNTVSDATGYKWGTTNVYSAATDNATSTTKTQTGLNCITAYTLYVWAYNTCGNSTVTSLTQTTSACCTPCGSSVGCTATTDGSYTVLKFTTVGTTTWVPCGVSQVEVLVVGGGGSGGGSSEAGGGGAGGLVYNVSKEVLSGVPLTISVGGGGASVTGTSGNSGGNSIFSDITAYGGGAGGYTTPSSGGSGGGGFHNTSYPGGSTTQPTSGPSAGFGNNGASGNTTNAGGGGGGGADQAGQRSSTEYYGGNGGNGKSYSITGTSVVYAAGGGGSAHQSFSPVTYGGKGGSSSIGGDGGGNAAPAKPNGDANTGSGGGGGGWNGANIPSGAGGSGIIVVRYLTP